MASSGFSFTDLGNEIEKVARIERGEPTTADMQLIFDAGYAKGVEDAERKRAETLHAIGFEPDGTPNWKAIAAHLHVRKHLFAGDARVTDFIDDISARTSFGTLKPSPRTGGWLLSLFYQAGGRIK
jgi:hypothetical protein